MYVFATPGKYRDPSEDPRGPKEVTLIFEVKLPVAKLRELMPRSTGAYPPGAPFKGPRTFTAPVGSTVSEGRPFTFPISTVLGTTGDT
jgi:hypothetical protein